MKIIHIISSLKEVSGPTQSVRNLCYEQYKKNSKNIKLVSVDFKQEYKKLPFSKLFPLGFGPKKLGRSPKLYKWLRSNAVKNNQLIFHNHSMWHMLSLYASWVKKYPSIKIIQSTRNALAKISLNSGSKIKPIYWHLFQKRALKKVDCFHATSEAEYKDIRALGFKQPIAIIPNAIDITNKIEISNYSEDRILLFMGRLHPEKGLETLLEAWQILQIRFGGWKLKIVGTGEKRYSESIKKMSKKLCLKRIEFCEPVFGIDKWSTYANSDIFVLPSPSENFGMVVAESLACGTPVVTTYGTPWHKLPKNGAGWCQDYGTESLLISLKEAMSKSRHELDRMGKKGRDWIVSDFSSTKVSQDMHEVYNWLFDQTKTAPRCVRTN